LEKDNESEKGNEDSVNEATATNDVLDVLDVPTLISRDGSDDASIKEK
jgi:hypothetical protein